ncbi:helicase associated domain-containing protein [Streptomyces sp. NPDC006670]|uniref:helicase associated domain-containing protein n=1 Tax=Streptomyces sp. NPDC006670 TaxID=3154476 RepID=UPI00340F9A42
MKPARVVRARKTSAKTSTATASGRSAAAFEAGIQALAQYVEREGGGLPGRQHVEHLPGAVHRTGVWLANQRQRRGRLTEEQLAALAELGVDWARYRGLAASWWWGRQKSRCPRPADEHQKPAGVPPDMAPPRHSGEALHQGAGPSAGYTQLTPQ